MTLEEELNDPRFGPPRRPMNEPTETATPDLPPYARVVNGNYLPCDYPEDTGHENGTYANKCRCGTEFIGHKRRMLCRVCAEQPAPPQPEPHAELKAAHAAGSAIQSETTRGDGTHIEWVDCPDPQWYPHIRYRIKGDPPQPEPQRIEKPYEYLGNFSAVGPAYSRGMQCHECRVEWTGCWDNFQCPRCGQGELPSCEPSSIPLQLPEPQQSAFLRHILDESHAGCLNGCLYCGAINELAAQEAQDIKADQHYAGYNAAVESEPQQSAVEWVQSKLAPLGGGIGRPTIAVMREDDALELARRCDAAEAKHTHFIYRNTRYKLLEQEADQLRAQLAAIQPLALQCVEWYLGDTDECGEVARKLYSLLEGQP